MIIPTGKYAQSINLRVVAQDMGLMAERCSASEPYFKSKVSAICTAAACQSLQIVRIGPSQILAIEGLTYRDIADAIY